MDYLGSCDKRLEFDWGAEATGFYPTGRNRALISGWERAMESWIGRADYFLQPDTLV